MLVEDTKKNELQKISVKCSCDRKDLLCICIDSTTVCAYLSLEVFQVGSTVLSLDPMGFEGTKL